MTFRLSCVALIALTAACSNASTTSSGGPAAAGIGGTPGSAGTASNLAAGGGGASSGAASAGGASSNAGGRAGSTQSDVDASVPDAAPDGAPSQPPTFVHAVQDQLLDGSGAHLLFRTAAIGNWLLNEGYALQLDGDSADRSRRIEARVTEMIGATAAAPFWQSYRDNYITEADFARMQALGFNSVRVAMNARLLLPEGQDQFDETEFKHLSDVVEWGGRHEIYVIFDMHGAPGGQTGRNIDDDINDTPDLFTIKDNQDRLVKLWTEIARRFAQSPTVAGYDLLNEPLPAQFFAQYNPQLYPLYQRVGQAIRVVDPNHLLIVEGSDWADNWSTLGAPFDDNMAYSFHKYWNASDISSIQSYLDYRKQWKRPIWCGEIGENDDDWYQANFKLLEDNDIGWSFWAWKKLDSGNNPYSVRLPTGWDLIQAYASNPSSTKPDPAKALAALDGLLDNIKFANCDFNKDAVCSLTPVLSQQPLCTN
ncbi:MAG TPA: cellulase family glycosylhydrolase [Polyangiaceae bacterium]|nr:cellulase family glycosylhydrolase [Polyangiaceae bacterium]